MVPEHLLRTPASQVLRELSAGGRQPGHDLIVRLTDLVREELEDSLEALPGVQRNGDGAAQAGTLGCSGALHAPVPAQIGDPDRSGAGPDMARAGPGRVRRIDRRRQLRRRRARARPVLFQTATHSSASESAVRCQAPPNDHPRVPHTVLSTCWNSCGGGRELGEGAGDRLLTGQEALEQTQVAGGAPLGCVVRHRRTHRRRDAHP